MSKKITIRVYPDGRIESKTVGVKGKSCLKYLKDIEDITDAKVLRSEYTQEYSEIKKETSLYTKKTEIN